MLHPLFNIICLTTLFFMPNSLKNYSVQYQLLNTIDNISANYLFFIPKSNVLIGADSHVVHCIEDEQLSSTLYIDHILPINGIAWHENSNIIDIYPHQYQWQTALITPYKGFPAALQSEIARHSDAYFCNAYVANDKNCYAAIEWRPSRRGGTPNKKIGLYAFEANNDAFFKELPLPNNTYINRLMLIGKNDLLSIGSSLCLYNLADDTQAPQCISPFKGYAKSAAVYNDNTLIVMGLPSNICVVNKQLAVQQQFDTRQNVINTMAVHPQYPLIFTGGDDGTVKCWTFEGKLITQINTQIPVHTIAINSQGNRIAFYHNLPEPQIAIYELKVNI